MARAHHETALRQDEGGAERVLVRAEERGDEHVATGLEASVDAKPHAPPETLGDKRPLRLYQAKLPGSACVLDRGERARAGAAVSPRDVDDVGEGLDASGRHEPDVRGRDELHGDLCTRVHLAQVEDQLSEVFDRVDVVVGRRRDQRHPWLRVAQARDLRRDLVSGELAAFARLRALGDLDLDLLGECEVLGREPEAPRGDLLDRRVALVPVAARILSPLAGVRPRADGVQRNRHGFVCLGRERAVGHGAAGETTQDRFGGLHVLERHRRSPAAGSRRSRSSSGARSFTRAAKRS
jgi:hypothetical protein